MVFLVESLATVSSSTVVRRSAKGLFAIREDNLHSNFIQRCGKSMFPLFSIFILQVLSKYYQYTRQNAVSSSSFFSGPVSQSRYTARMLESLIRLAQAHARLTCRNQVLLLVYWIGECTIGIGCNYGDHDCRDKCPVLLLVEFGPLSK